MTMTMGNANNALTGEPTPEGTYLVQLKRIERTDPTQYSPDGQFKWVAIIDEVMVGDDDAEEKLGEELWAYSNILPNGYGPKSKSRQNWEAFAGRDLEDGEAMTGEAIYGNFALAYVVPHTKADGSKTTKVERFAKAPKKRKAKAQADDEDLSF